MYKGASVGYGSLSLMKTSASLDSVASTGEHIGTK